MNKKLNRALMAVTFLFASQSFAACPQVISFPLFQDLTSKQQELISSVISNADKAYATWGQRNDGLMAAFLANTQAWGRMYFFMADGSAMPALDMIDHIKHVEGDRLKVAFKKDLFKAWTDAGAYYEIDTANGKREQGRFKFDHGDLGGSRHKGYDIQGYTSRMKMPRLQINYRFEDSEADIDIDAYQPWIFGFIPDPVHMTWGNSDVRCWMNKFEKKFGPLSVRLR